MGWIWVALAPPLLYALANLTDKHLVDNLASNTSLAAISALFGATALPVILIVDRSVLDIEVAGAALQLFAGACGGLSVLCYFRALEGAEASEVVSFYQLIPVFGFALGWLFLGETLRFEQGLGAVIAVSGAAFLSLDLAGGTPRPRVALAGFMTAAAFLEAAASVAFKWTATRNGYWPSLFWGFCGRAGFGILLLGVSPVARAECLAATGRRMLAVLRLSAVSEGFYVLAESLLDFATLLAPVSLVLAVAATQPAFVLALGALGRAALRGPRRAAPTGMGLAQSAAGVGLVVAGAVYMSLG